MLKYNCINCVVNGAGIAQVNVDRYGEFKSNMSRLQVDVNVFSIEKMLNACCRIGAESRFIAFH